jgi:hypothetical protein
VSLALSVATEIVLTARFHQCDFQPKFCSKSTLHDTTEPMKLFLAHSVVFVGSILWKNESGWFLFVVSLWLSGATEIVVPTARIHHCDFQPKFCSKSRVPFFGFWIFWVLGSGNYFEFPRTPFFWRANLPEPSRISQNPKKPACLRKRRTQHDYQHDYVVLSLTWRRRTTIGAIEFQIKNNQFICFF